MAKMPPHTCSSSNCTQPGVSVCSLCRVTNYCSRACQKTDWRTHKPNCAGLQTFNAFIIRAAPASAVNDIRSRIEPLHLEHYGNEREEKRELATRLGWVNVGEVGKFYDHTGSDNWYYYVYGDVSPKASSTRIRNTIADRICKNRSVLGDIVVLRSGPLGAVYPTCFTREELCNTVAFYEKEDRGNVFLAREKSRFLRMSGMKELPPNTLHYSAV